MLPGGVGVPRPPPLPKTRPAAGRGRVHREGPRRPRPRKPHAGPHRASRPHTSRSPAGLRLRPRVSTGAVAPGRQPQGNTCRGRMRRARGRTHLRAGGARPGGDPGVPGPLCPGSPRGRGARWGKGTRAATALTWQHLLLHRRQQQSRQPLAPSSAAASSAAAATNRPSGTANRHNRRRPRCRSRPRAPGGREGSGRRGDAVRPLGSGSGAGGQGAAAGQSRGAGAIRRPPPRQRRGLCRAADTAAVGFVIVDSVPSSAEHAGKRWAGGGARRAAGAAQRGARRSGSRQAAGKRGAAPPSVAVGRPATLLSSSDPGTQLGRPLAVRAAVRPRTAPR